MARVRKPIDPEHLAAANEVLDTFSRGTFISTLPSGLHVLWPSFYGKNPFVRKRWQTRGGQDFYATWSNLYPGGGTSMTALSQLIRWLQGKSVLPIATWRMWAGEIVELLPMDAVDRLLAAGYPEVAECCLCGRPITKSLDWWHLDKVSGPCCGWTSGCRQRPAEAAKPL